MADDQGIYSAKRRMSAADVMKAFPSEPLLVQVLSFLKARHWNIDHSSWDDDEVAELAEAIELQIKDGR